jgi:hypothetical protein
MFELLNTAAKETDSSLSRNMKTIKNIVPSFSYDVYQCTFTVDPKRRQPPHDGSGHFPDGIPLDSLNNTREKSIRARLVGRII